MRYFQSLSNLTGVINYVFCTYICCFITNFSYRTRLVVNSCNRIVAEPKLSLFSFLFTWPLKPFPQIEYQTHGTILTFWVKQCQDPDLSESRDVIGHVTI